VSRLRVRLLGTGPSQGVPELGGLWGACDPAEPRNQRGRCACLGGHGIGTRLLVDAPDGRLGSSRISAGDLAARVCPVGAILPKRRGFVVPIGERRFDASPGTARGMPDGEAP